MTHVKELMSALPRTLWVSQSLSEAVGLFDYETPAVVVVDPQDHPVGLITKAAVSREAARHPSRWSSIPCAHLLETITAELRPDNSLEEVLAEYRARGTRALLVFNGADPISVLYPEYVLASTPSSDRPPPRSSHQVSTPSSES